MIEIDPIRYYNLKFFVLIHLYIYIKLQVLLFVCLVSTKVGVLSPQQVMGDEHIHV